MFYSKYNIHNPMKSIGMTLWVDAFETLAMFGIFTVMYYSVAAEPKFKIGGAGRETGSQQNTRDSSAPIVDIVDSDFHSEPADVPNKIAIKPTFDKCFLYFGLFIGFLSILNFVADVLRFRNWFLFGHLSMAMSIIVGVVFLPVWLLVFAKQLPEATERFERVQRWEGVVQNAESETSELIQ